LITNVLKINNSLIYIMNIHSNPNLNLKYKSKPKSNFITNRILLYKLKLFSLGKSTHDLWKEPSQYKGNKHIVVDHRKPNTLVLKDENYNKSWTMESHSYPKELVRASHTGWHALNYSHYCVITLERSIIASDKTWTIFSIKNITY